MEEEFCTLFQNPVPARRDEIHPTSYQICTRSLSTQIRPAASRWARRCTPSATRQPLCSHRPGPARTQRKVVLASGGALVTSVTHCLTRLPSRVDQQTAPSMGKQATFNIILGAALLAAPAAHIMSRHYCASPPPGTREAARMRLCTLHGVYRSQRAFSRLPAS